EKFISPIYISALRALVGGIVLLIIFRKIIYGVKETIAGLLNMAFFLIFLNLGIMYSKNPSLSAVLVYTQPIFVVILSKFYLKSRITLLQYIGIITGFFGILLTAISTIGFSIGLIFSLLSGFSWAIGTVYFVRHLANKDIIALNSYMSLISFPVIISFLPLSHYFEINVSSIIILIYTTLIIQILAWLLWFYAVKYIGPVRSSSLVMLTPISSFIFTIALMHVFPNYLQLAGSIFAIIGSLIAQIGRKT
ncbi:MAG: DMT family transporter, partial [Caldisphaera sp.]|nr:DMT family transporter [Caldisphaera sp.]